MDLKTDPNFPMHLLRIFLVSSASILETALHDMWGDDQINANSHFTCLHQNRKVWFVGKFQFFKQSFSISRWVIPPGRLREIRWPPRPLLVCFVQFYASLLFKDILATQEWSWHDLLIRRVGDTTMTATSTFWSLKAKIRRESQSVQSFAARAGLSPWYSNDNSLQQHRST